LHRDVRARPRTAGVPDRLRPTAPALRPPLPGHRHMKAAVLHTPGSPPAYGEHPPPAPASGHSVVRVKAAPVVPLDLLCASGTSYFGVPATPYVPGVQGVGVVTQSEVVDEGTHVWFSVDAGMVPGDGSLGELCSVPVERFVPLDTDLP